MISIDYEVIISDLIDTQLHHYKYACNGYILLKRDGEVVGAKILLSCI